MSEQTSLFSDANYSAFLNGLKERLRSAQVKAMLAVNQKLISLYWQIGQDILTRQQPQGWGVKVIDRLAKDLKREFPDIRGGRAQISFYMRAFAEAYLEKAIVQQVVGQIPEGHN